MRHRIIVPRGRLWAVSLCLLLAGCVQGGGTTPLGASLVTLWGTADDIHRERAEALPYASLLVSTGGNTSLLVLAYQGSAGEQTLWQARDRATLEFRHGRLYRTAGFPAELLSWHPTRPVEPGSYAVSVSWRDARGDEHLARGEATLTCTPPQSLTLPLTTLPLEQCEERIDWMDGETSVNTLWRHLDSGRLWAGEVAPWPGAEPVRWQVARPWWSE